MKRLVKMKTCRLVLSCSLLAGHGGDAKKRMKTLPLSTHQDCWSWELPFYRTVFILVSVFILFLLSDYGKNSVHPEYVAFRGTEGFITYTVRNGPSLVSEDFLRGFEVLSFEGGGPRVRFLSNLLLLLTVKLRIWLWNYLPPHPSFSLTWFFSLILSPLLFYRFIYGLTSDRRASWIGVSLYCLSVGFLSGVLGRFHPAKSMTNFLAIAGFYCATRILNLARQDRRLSRKIIPTQPSTSEGILLDRAGGRTAGTQDLAWNRGDSRSGSPLRTHAVLSRKIWGAFTALLVILWLGFFTDETAWFLFFIVPVLFPDIFKIKGKGRQFAILYLAMGVLFLFFITFVAAPFLKKYGFANFDFWTWVTSSNTSDRAGAFVFSNVIRQGYNFLAEYVTPFGWQDPFRFGLCIIFCLYVGWMIIRLPAGRKRLCVRVLLSLGVFLFCQTILLTRHLVVVNSTWYYGAMFPIFFSLLGALLLSPGSGWLRILNKIIFILLLAIAVSHDLHPRATNPWMTYSDALMAWRERGKEATLASLQSYYPRGGAWMFIELRYAAPANHKPGVVRTLGKIAEWLGEIGRKPNLLTREGVVVTAVPGNSLSKNVWALIDGRPYTFWHTTATQTGQPVGLKVDFGEGHSRKVRMLAARPRHNDLRHFFNRTRLLGSTDEVNWEPITVITTDDCPEDSFWIHWAFENDREFRYYQLLLESSFMPESFSTYSLAELGMYE